MKCNDCGTRYFLYGYRDRRTGVWEELGPPYNGYSPTFGVCFLCFLCESCTDRDECYEIQHFAQPIPGVGP